MVVACLIVLATAPPSALAQGASPSPPTPGTESAAESRKAMELLEAREVRVEIPVTFWREGRQESTTTAVLLRVRVGHPSLFIPRGITNPLFVYGRAICQVLRSPFPSGEAVLLAPAVSADETPMLWLTPIGLALEDLDKDLIRRYQPERSELERGGALLAKPTTDMTDMSGRVYKDVEELRKDAVSKK